MLSKTHTLEKAVIDLLNVDGWNLTHTGSGYEFFDAMGLTPKGYECVIEMKFRKKYYDEKNILELILMTKTFEIPDSDLSLDLLDLDIYIKEITNMTTKIKTIHENMIWLLYYGNENQKLTVRRNLLDKLNKKED